MPLTDALGLLQSYYLELHLQKSTMLALKEPDCFVVRLASSHFALLFVVATAVDQVRVVGSGGAPLLASESTGEAKDVKMSVHQPTLMIVPGAVMGAKLNEAAPFGLFDSGVDDRAVLLTCYSHCVHSLRRSVTTFVFCFFV